MLSSFLKGLTSFRCHPGFYIHKIPLFLKVHSVGYSAKLPAFYNREKEIAYLVNVLEKPLTLSLIMGLVNSGDSWVMDKLLQEVSKERKKPNVLPVQLHSLPHTTVLGCSHQHIILGHTVALHMCIKLPP